MESAVRGLLVTSKRDLSELNHMKGDWKDFGLSPGISAGI